MQCHPLPESAGTFSRSVGQEAHLAHVDLVAVLAHEAAPHLTRMAPAHAAQHCESCFFVSPLGFSASPAGRTVL